MDSSTSTYHQKRGHMFFLEHSVDLLLNIVYVIELNTSRELLLLIFCVFHKVV